MSDLVLVALIGAVQIVIVAWLNSRAAKRIEAQAAETKAAAVETKAAIIEAKAAIVTIEKQTNSMKDELVKVTGKEQRAIGKLEGKAEQLEEGAG